MFHSVAGEETSDVSKIVVKCGADAWSASLGTLDKKSAPWSSWLHHALSSWVGACTHEHIFGPSYVKRHASDDYSVAAGSTNTDHCSPPPYPERGVSSHSNS